MRFRTVAFLAAFLYHGFPGMAAFALPPVPLGFCDTHPEAPLCNLEELPELEPAPGEPELVLATAGTLHGSIRVSGRKVTTETEAAIELLGTETDVSMAFHGICLGLTGPYTADPSNPSRKFEVHLDESSSATLGSLVAAVVDDPASNVLGGMVRERVTVTVKIREDGTFFVKLRGGVRFEKVGRVGLEARFEGTVAPALVDSSAAIPIPGCM